MDLAITGFAGNYMLTFTPTSLAAVTSGSFTLTFGAATASAITVQPSGAVNGVAFTTQPVVRIVDSGGNTATSSTVNVVATIASGGCACGAGVLSGATTVAAVNGVATFTDLAITGFAGNYTLTFTPTSLAAVTSSSFALTSVVCVGGPPPPQAPLAPPIASIDIPVTRLVTFTEESKIEASIEATCRPNPIVTVTVPIGAVSRNVTVSITAAVTPVEASTGVVSIKVTATDAAGALVTHFDKPLVLNLGPMSIGDIVAFSQDGLVWTNVQLLSETTLPAGVHEGYYLAADGSVMILTDHLTYFGIKRVQAPLVLYANAIQIPLGGFAAIFTTGGSGSGARTYLTSTPSICAVDHGLVTPLKAGTCTVWATKAGDGTYLETSTATLDLTFVDLMPQAAPPTKTPTKFVKTITVSGSGQTRLVEVNLGPEFGGKTFSIQIREAGATTYQTLYVVKLNVMGVARTTRWLIPLGATIRVLANNRTLVSTVVTPSAAPPTSPAATFVKTIIVSGSGQTRLVEVNLGPEFGGKTFSIQIREAGATTYKTLYVVKLNAAGVARTTRWLIPLGATIRVLANDKTLVSTIVQ